MYGQDGDVVSIHYQLIVYMCTLQLIYVQQEQNRGECIKINLQLFLCPGIVLETVIIGTDSVGR